ncbi:MAG: hypothetical protein JXR83_10845 [Deltaproteobacteria bacterium]|nr:hypothetical protein [Deltaproteobacteria bacterium]
MLKEIAAALREKDGQLTLPSATIKAFKEKCKKIDHAAEAWMLAEDLVSLAFHLDTQKRSPKASQDVLGLVEVMTGALKKAIPADAAFGSDNRQKSSRAAIGAATSNRPLEARKGKGKGQSVLSTRAGRR